MRQVQWGLERDAKYRWLVSAESTGSNKIYRLPKLQLVVEKNSFPLRGQQLDAVRRPRPGTKRRRRCSQSHSSDHFFLSRPPVSGWLKMSQAQWASWRALREQGEARGRPTILWGSSHYKPRGWPRVKERNSESDCVSSWTDSFSDSFFIDHFLSPVHDIARGWRTELFESRGY